MSEAPAEDKSAVSSTPEIVVPASPAEASVVVSPSDPKNNVVVLEVGPHPWDMRLRLIFHIFVRLLDLVCINLRLLWMILVMLDTLHARQYFTPALLSVLSMVAYEGLFQWLIGMLWIYDDEYNLDPLDPECLPNSWTQFPWVRGEILDSCWIFLWCVFRPYRLLELVFYDRREGKKNQGGPWRTGFRVLRDLGFCVMSIWAVIEYTATAAMVWAIIVSFICIFLAWGRLYAPCFFCGRNQDAPDPRFWADRFLGARNKENTGNGCVDRLIARFPVLGRVKARAVIFWNSLPVYFLRRLKKLILENLKPFWILSVCFQFWQPEYFLKMMKSTEDICLRAQRSSFYTVGWYVDARATLTLCCPGATCAAACPACNSSTLWTATDSTTICSNFSRDCAVVMGTTLMVAYSFAWTAFGIEGFRGLVGGLAAFAKDPFDQTWKPPGKWARASTLYSFGYFITAIFYWPRMYKFFRVDRDERYPDPPTTYAYRLICFLRDALYGVASLVPVLNAPEGLPPTSAFFFAVGIITAILALIQFFFAYGNQAKLDSQRGRAATEPQK